MRRKAIKAELTDPELLELISEEEEAWLNSLPTAELAKDGSKYIATKKKQIVAIASTLGDLYRRLNAKGVKNVRIRYIEDPRFVVIYR